MKYLTPQYYKTMDTGISLGDVPDLTLARTIQIAESDIDSHMEFDLTLGGFESHTGWVEYPFDARTRRIRIPNFPVPVRRTLQYRIQVSNLTTGLPFMATISPNDVAYQVFEFYVEIVPLTSITYALAPTIMQYGLQPPIVQWDYEAGYYFGVTGEPLINSGDNLTYYASRGFWATTYTQAASIRPFTLPPVPPVVYVNGTVQASGYTTNPTEGTVTFNSGQQATDVVSLDYTYTIPDPVRDACIAQVTYLLGQRALNKMGMQGIEMARSDMQQLKRHMNADVKGTDSPLCYDASEKLEPYKMIPVA